MSNSIYNSSFKLAFLTSCLLLILSSVVVAQIDEIAITTNSERARELFIEGRKWSENIQVVKAAELFDNAIKIDPDFALAHIFRAVTGVGGFNVSRKHMDRALSLIENVTQGEKDLILFDAALIEGNQLNQKVYLDKMLGSFPSDKRVQLWAGNYFYTIKDFQTAKTYLMKAIQMDEKFAPVYNMLGYTELQLNQNTEAEQSFKTYISLIPESPNPYDSYAEFLLKTGRYDESIDQYETALQKDSHFTSALNGIGHNFVFKGNFIEARKNYQKCFDAATTINAKLGALFWMATSFVHEGKIDDALKTIEKQRTLAKENDLTTNVINTYNTEGLILTEAGMLQKGMKKFETAAKLIQAATLPDDTKETLMLQADMNRCYAMIADKKLDEAQRELAILASEINKRNNPAEIEQLNGNLGLLEIKRGNYQQAIEYLNKADQTSDFNKYYLGVAYDGIGNKYKANECFQQVKNSRTNNIGLAIVRSRATE